MSAVQGFLPSSRGFRFKNAWAKVPAFTINVLGVDVPIGDASNGLCGGMVFAVRDYFEQDRPLPQDTAAPSKGPLYTYIGQRLKDSFDLPLGPTRYLDAMAAPDGDKGRFFGWILGKRATGIASRTIRDELPKILDDIDAGQLSCVGLVCARGVNPLDLGENHQVLAYRYERTGHAVELFVYDPNRPLRDDARLVFSTRSPTKPTPISFVNGSKRVRGFFRVDYKPDTPPS